MQKNSPKVVLITGGAQRIGAQIATYLHAADMNIVIHYNTSKDEAEALCATLNKKRKHSAIIVHADLQDLGTLNYLCDEAQAAWGRLDVLINNASKFYKTELGKVTEYAWDDLITINAKAPLFLSQAVAPHLAKTQGCIVNIADIHGERPMRGYAVYCISKAAIVMLTLQLAKELAPNIRVNAVSPGPVLWPNGKNKLTAEQKQDLIARTALQKSGDPESVAKAVLYLIQDADYVTGQIIAVDGGRLLNL